MTKLNSTSSLLGFVVEVLTKRLQRTDYTLPTHYYQFVVGICSRSFNRTVTTHFYKASRIQAKV